MKVHICTLLGECFSRKYTGMLKVPSLKYQRSNLGRFKAQFAASCHWCNFVNSRIQTQSMCAAKSSNHYGRMILSGALRLRLRSPFQAHWPSNSLDFPKPAGPRPGTRLVGCKPTGVIHRLQVFPSNRGFPQAGSGFKVSTFVVTFDRF